MTTSGGGRSGHSLPGTVLDGRYRVGAVIARGGMSVVYRATDLRLDRPVAVKVMDASFAADPSFLTRFEREARAAAGLAHPGVVAVYDQGRDGNVVFLVMELVDGGNLRDLMRQCGALSVAVTMAVLEPLLAALGAAHAAGLVHRDVKPENVLISARGEVKVADFGLVRAVASTSSATGNVILGTLAYLSPEQVATGAADPRSDVYAVGIVAYEMLTGHPPYEGDNALSVAYRHVNADVPSVTARAPGVPHGLDQLILAATRRDARVRPRDAGAFLAALVAVRARLGLGRAPVPVPRSAGGTPPPTRAVGYTDAVVQSLPARRPAVLTTRSTTARSTTARSATALSAAAVTRSAGPAPVVGPRIPARAGSAPMPSAGTTMVSAVAAGPAEEVRRSSRSRFRRWLLVLIVVLLLGVAAAAGGWWLGTGRWAYTPAAVGVGGESAQGLVRAAGLVPHVRGAPSDTVAAGMVSSSRPIPGARVLRGSGVDLEVSTGRPVVPAVLPGSAADAAEQVLRAVGLTPRLDPAADRYDDVIPAGAVLTTDPAADTALRIAAPVVVVLSKGPQPRPVPAVAGKSVDDARQALLAAGFEVGPSQRAFAAGVDDGTVLGTNPQEGRPVALGSPVSLMVAASLTVPSVRGEPSGQAVADLERAGFTVTLGDPVVDGDIDGGCAVGTDPDAGSRVDPAAPAVVLTVSDAVTVPDVTRGNLGAARQQLAALGLQADVTALFGRSGASVIDQMPSAGARVEPGATVQISAFP